MQIKFAACCPVLADFVCHSLKGIGGTTSTEGRSGYSVKILCVAAKTMRVMQLTAIFLLVTGLHVAASGLSQSVSFSGQNVPLQEVFSAVKKQTGFLVSYQKEQLKNAKPVTIDVKNVLLKEFLEQVLKDQELDFVIEDNTVFVRKREMKLKSIPDITSSFTAPPVTGIVRGPDGQPIAGVNIIVKGTKRGASSKRDGSFQIEVNTGDILVVSFVGYANQEITIGNNNEIGIVVLAPSLSKLDEVQIIGYGKTSRRFNTGNTTTIKASEIENQPVSNVLQALIGRVPGLQISPENNIPGGGITVRVQGQNSISNGNDPLYVVDGVPYVSQMLPTTSGTILGGSGAPGAGNGNPLSYLNPNDIESIDVLKDADATAIYGSRAANGAILITTKQGKSGKTDINIGVQSGWGRVARFLPLMNTVQYLEMRHEAFRNDGTLTPASNEYDINGLWDTTRYTDWQKVLAGGTAQYQNITGSVSGGSTNTRFLIGASYRRETSIFSNDFADKKGGVHFNINHSSLNQRFNIQLTGNYLSDVNILPSINPGYAAISLAPNAPSLYEADGKTLNWAPNALGSSSWGNPLLSFLRQYQNKTKNLISNAILSYELLPGLSAKTNFGYNNLETDEFIGSPLAAVQPENRPFTPRTAIFSNSVISSWIIEPQITYNKVIGVNNFSALAGSTFQQRNSNGRNLTASGFANDTAISDIGSATSITPNSSVAAVYKYNALFGRLNYNLDNRYIINFNIRRDGSSRFGSANKFHTFWSLGAAWIISEEDFLRKNISFVSFLKLRASYGTTGNDQIADYLYYNLFSPRNYDMPYQNGVILSEDRLTNPYLQWEETNKLLFGIDLGIIKDRLLIKLDYARNRSSNQLIETMLPSITGYTGMQINFPAVVQNTSFELSVNVSVIKNKNLDWTITGNVTLPKNKLIDFPDLATSVWADYLVIGQPLNAARLYHYMGVDKETGLYQFAGSDGKPTTEPEETDRTVFLNTSPEVYGGFGNNISFRNFQLKLFFQFASQKQQGYMFGNLSSFYPPGRRTTNQPIYVMNRWQKPGDITGIQKYSGNASLLGSYNYLKGSDAYFEDASFLRLQNVSFSYQLPLKEKEKIVLKSLKVFVEVQNLFTISGFKGLDPESPLNSRIRYLTAGVQIGM